MRIVSLLPSATEIVAEIGLADQLVGVSHECDFPHGVTGLPAVTHSRIHGGLPSTEIDALVREQLGSEQALYHLDLALMEELKPDLIVTQALCDVCAVAAVEVESAACKLSSQPAIVNLEPMCLQEVFDTMLLVGKATNSQQQAQHHVDKLKQRIAAVTKRTESITAATRPRVAFLEWIEPLFNAGHWTPELIELAGGIDCLGSKHQPSRTITPTELVASSPDVLFVAQCGFKEARTLQDLPALTSLPDFKSLPCTKSKRLYYTDGNAYFSRPGPRLVDSLEIMAHTLHPDIHPLPEHLHPAVQFNSN